MVNNNDMTSILLEHGVLWQDGAPHEVGNPLFVQLVQCVDT